jgi:hypothetical protein
VQVRTRSRVAVEAAVAAAAAVGKAATEAARARSTSTAATRAGEDSTGGRLLSRWVKSHIWKTALLVENLDAEPTQIAYSGASQKMLKIGTFRKSVVTVPGVIRC